MLGTCFSNAAKANQEAQKNNRIQSQHQKTIDKTYAAFWCNNLVSLKERSVKIIWVLPLRSK